MRIGTNVVALKAQNSLRLGNDAMQKAMLKLSTGKRINSAADDPAGFAMAANMHKQISGMAQSRRNALDGLSLAQTAEGALGEVTNMAQRMRELALNSASGSYTDGQRSSMNVEVKQLAIQIVETLQRAKFNGASLFDIGAAGTGSGVPGTPGYGTATTLQLGERAGDTHNLVIDNIDTAWAAGATIGTVGDANTMLTTMDDFLKGITKARAGLGAQQNGLETTISMLDTSITNMSEAVSRIEDTDYAAESMNLARAQIMVQSSTAMLAQANQSQKIVLDLIR